MRRTLLAAVVLASGLGAAHAADLRDAWQAARQHHPDMAAAASVRAAADARRLQASRLWNPTLAAQAAGGAMGASTSIQGAAFSMPGSPPVPGVGFDTSARTGSGARWGLEARMPLYSPERSAQQRQLLLSADLADLQAASAQQQLMLRTAQLYLGAVLAQQQHQLLQHQQQTTDRAWSEAQDRFTLGDAPITDVREAEARARLTAAQAQAAEVEMQIARGALANITGWDAGKLPPLHAPAARAPAPLAPLAHWLDRAAQDNLQVRTQAQAVTLATQEAAKATRAAGSKVDLVAQAGGEHLSGSGRYGAASNTARQYLVGVQVQVPLYTGGQRPARLKELLHLQDKAAADLDSARLATAQQVQSTWLQLQAGDARIRALETAQQAAELRLQATQLGRTVGDRTTLELLQAHSDAVAAKSQLLQQQVRLVLDWLQLLALAGALDEAALAGTTQGEGAAPTPATAQPQHAR